VSSKENLAIIKTGGKQYIVKEGDVISVEKIDTDKETVEFETVLLVKETDQISIGTPNLNYVVSADILEHEEKDKKVRVFKFKRKTGYKKTQGHRQRYTTVRIKSIKKIDA
jgi:large subunit ribosomal protein L21